MSLLEKENAAKTRRVLIFINLVPSIDARQMRRRGCDAPAPGRTRLETAVGQPTISHVGTTEPLRTSTLSGMYPDEETQPEHTTSKRQVSHSCQQGRWGRKQTRSDRGQAGVCSVESYPWFTQGTYMIQQGSFNHGDKCSRRSLKHQNNGTKNTARATSDSIVVKGINHSSGRRTV